MAMHCTVTADGKVVQGEVARILHEPLPSTRLQTHHRAYYVGNIIYPSKRIVQPPHSENP